MLRAMKVFRALCLAGLAVGVAVALLASLRSPAGADPAPATITTTTAATGPVKLGQGAVGMKGPIGATVTGTAATGTVPGFRPPQFPRLPALHLPDPEAWFKVAVGGLAVGCLFLVAAVRL